MQCEFCKQKEGGEIEIKAYRYGETLALSCRDCAGENIMTDNLTPIELPNGWIIVSEKEYDTTERASRSFAEVAKIIEAYQVKYLLPSHNLYDADIALGNIVKHLAKKLSFLDTRLDRIGLTLDFVDSIYAEAFCPTCKSLLIEVTPYGLDDALKIAMRGTYSEAEDKLALVCLSCKNVYVESFEHSENGE